MMRKSLTGFDCCLIPSWGSLDLFVLTKGDAIASDFSDLSFEFPF